MPSFWTHASFAEECKATLTDISEAGMPVGYLSDAILAHPHAFFTGMQGPDLFFFYPPTALGKKKLSSMLHTKETPRFLCCLFAKAHTFAGEDRRLALSYVCGFLGHYLLDSHTHAFVYARAGTERSAKNYSIHNALEADLNRLSVKRSFGIDLRDLPPPCSYRLSAAERRVLSRLFAESLRKVYRIHCSPSMVSRAFSSVHLATRLLYDAHGRKAAIARSLERPLGHPYVSPLFLGESRYFYDPANLTHRSWIDPYTGKISHDTFFELYDRALMRFLPILRRLEATPRLTSKGRRLLFEKLCRRDFHGEPIST